MKVSELKKDEKAQALAQLLELKAKDIDPQYDNTYEADGSEYLVLTDDEADEANDERIDNYIDEYILPELPEQYQVYFDRDAFTRDARHDGRGHNLSTYDGSEEYTTVNGTEYYIYRTN